MKMKFDPDTCPLAVAYGWRSEYRRTEPLYMYPPQVLGLHRTRMTALDPNDLPEYVRAEVAYRYLTEAQKK